MSKDLQIPSAERFGLASFAELLPRRDPIIGEAPGSFDGFRGGMMRSLMPFTPYECVIAENLISIEWELVQHRHMREANIRQQIKATVRKAVFDHERELVQDELEASWEAHVKAGGDGEDWDTTSIFDHKSAEELADELSAMSCSPDPQSQAEAHEQLAQLGLDPIKMMSDAFLERGVPAEQHDQKVQELERRRREVKRDYDALQKSRPIDGQVIEG